jgi:uncharacterized peroxidase-related enzyme
MTRVPAIDPTTAPASVKPLLDGVEAALGTVPNLMRGLANSRAALKGYLDLNRALAGGSLGAPLREQIALAVAEANGCGYCLAAHTTLGAGAGLQDDDIVAARRGTATDSRQAAAIALAVGLVEGKGHVDDAVVARARGAGFTDGEITEIVVEVALNVLTNYFNIFAGTEIDFPETDPLERAA